MLSQGRAFSRLLPAASSLASRAPTPSHAPFAAAAKLPPLGAADQRRNYAKKKPHKPGKKGSSAAIDDLLDDIDSSDDEDDGKRLSSSSKRLEVEEDYAALSDSPLARFIADCQKQKGSKKKGDSKGKMKGKSAHATKVTYAEVRQIMDFDAYWASMQKELDGLKEHFVRHLNLRSSTSLDDLPVPLEGDTFPLKEMASISKGDPKRVVIDSSSFPQATKSIVEAIRDSGMNLNPQQEGTRVYVTLPKVTREHRERLAGGARARAGEAKERLKRAQSRWISRLGEMELEDSGPPADVLRSTKEVVMAAEAHFAAEADRMAAAKRKELMGDAK